MFNHTMHYGILVTLTCFFIISKETNAQTGSPWFQLIPDEVEETSAEDATVQNSLGTTLYFTKKGGCTSDQRKQIKQAYKDFHAIADLEGVKNNINWNEASALEFLGPADFIKNQQAQIQAVFANMATVSDGYLPFVHHWIYARCDDIRNGCSVNTCPNPDNQPRNPLLVKDAFAYSLNKAPDADYPMINFFFQKKSLGNAITYGASLDQVGANTLANYDNQAQTMFHEILHLHVGADSEGGSPNPEVEDLAMWVTDSVDQLRWLQTPVYGVGRCKVLARFIKEIDSQHETGYWTQRNSDNLAYFALAQYVQSVRGSYPHLPIITTEIISGSPWDPKALMALNANRPSEDILKKGWDNFEPVPGCPDILDPLSAAAVYNPDISMSLTKLSSETVYPAEYQAQKRAWLEEVVQIMGLSIQKRSETVVNRPSKIGYESRKWTA